MNIEIQILTIIVSSLLSGILGVVISIIYHRKYEKYWAKLETLRNLVGYRSDVRSVEFSKALNEILIVFQDSKEVLEAMENFREKLILNQNNNLANSYLLKLVKAMCKNLKIDINKVNDDNFLQAFNIKQY